MKTVTVLGSTGSIGVNTLDVVRQNRSDYRIFALAAGQNVETLAAQIIEFRPKVAVMAATDGIERIVSLLRKADLSRADWPELLTGPQALVQISTDPSVDHVVSAIVGVAGLEATYAAICRGKRVGLANKEVLVSAGEVVMRAVREHNAELLPIDSEHNGAHQVLRAGNRPQVSKLILTASGGPFRNTPIEKLAFVTPEQALNHPTWRMGNRITIDSATLMNKGFEVIEARWLFDFQPSEIDVVIHPQSTVHAMIEYSDGSVLAQIAATDMRMPIQYALTYPSRREAPVPRIDWAQARQWEFGPPDLAKFPLLKLAYECLETGGASTCILNAADEVAVEWFLQGKIPFTAISEVVQETLLSSPPSSPRTIAEVLDADRTARVLARQIAETRASRVVSV